MAHTTQKLESTELQFTYEDYLLLPEDGKQYEIIEGELFMTPAPIIKHQNVLSELGERLRRFVLKNHLGNVFYAPCDVIFSKTNVVQPDILFISKANQAIVTEKNIQGAPDLLIEITSASTKEKDVILKKKLYAKFGVKEYWIVFMEEEKIEVWQLQEKTFSLDNVYQRQDVLKSPLLQGLEIQLSEIFREIEDYFN